jgi:alkanesulfonate monooxygenase SsuD/methylene tetrahydromethanopterin reductase-like flavin-dependent oxidoreductase (luciferase family)
MSETAGLVLGLELDGEGSHPAAWRRAAHPPAGLFDPRRLVRLAETAERAGFAFVTLDDDIIPPGSDPDVVGRIGSVERAAYLSAALSVLSVVPAVPTTYSEPFHVSSQLASIDHLTAGRSGWVATVTGSPGAARAWGRPAVSGAAELGREAADAVEVVRALWDSWEDDAMIRDAASGRYLDRGRLHYVDFAGEGYSVKGPAIVPRPPQGQLVVFAEAGLVPDHLIDVSLVGAPDLAGLRAAAAASRVARTFAEVEVALDTPDRAAAERVADLGRHGAWTDRGRLRYVGAAAGLVRLLGELAGLVDGVRLHPAVLDEGSRRVVPAGDPAPDPRPRGQPAAARHDLPRGPRAAAPAQPVQRAAVVLRRSTPMTPADPADVPRPRAQLHFGVFFQGVNHTTIWSSPDSGSPAWTCCRAAGPAGM